MEDRTLRHRIYESFAVSGSAPGPEDLVDWCGGAGEAAAALRRLHDAHAVVVDDAGRIAMALPFSAQPTGHRVTAIDRAWWANCAWDSLAIPVATAADVAIRSTWMDDDRPVELEVSGGDLSDTRGFVHFVCPARHWWDDIAET